MVSCFGSFFPGQVVDGEDLFRLDGNILGLPACAIYSMREKVFTEQRLIAPTKKTVAAQFGIIADNTVSDPDIRHCGTGRDNLSSELMAWNQRKLCHELAFMNMQVCAADATGLNPDEYIMRSNFRVRLILITEVPRCCFSCSLYVATLTRLVG